MESIRTIRNRIKGVESTRQITKSMKMVASSKLRKTQGAFMSLKKYAEKSGELLREVSASGKAASSPFFGKRTEMKRVCYVLFLGNRGLCGVYNTGLLKYMESVAKNEDRDFFTVTVGRWGKEHLASMKIPVECSFSEMSDTPSSEDASEISEYLKKLYLEAKADEIVLVYQQYKSALQQSPGMLTLLPVKKERDSKVAEDYIFEPDAASLLEKLLNMYIDNTVYSVLLEAKTGEHTARVTAMTSATDNTEELIAELSLKLNRARQEAITTEITEISGGAAALNNQ